MRKFSQGVIIPRYEKSGLCRCCGHKLTISERCRNGMKEKYSVVSVMQ